MFKWLFRHVCLCYHDDVRPLPFSPLLSTSFHLHNSFHLYLHRGSPTLEILLTLQPEIDPLLSDFPPPSTILTAPSRHSRPSPLGDLPHHRLPHHRTHSSFSTPGIPSGSPSLVGGLPTGSTGWDSPAGLGEGSMRIATIGRFYSQYVPKHLHLDVDGGGRENSLTSY